MTRLVTLLHVCHGNLGSKEMLQLGTGFLDFNSQNIAPMIRIRKCRGLSQQYPCAMVRDGDSDGHHV